MDSTNIKHKIQIIKSQKGGRLIFLDKKYVFNSEHVNNFGTKRFLCKHYK